MILPSCGIKKRGFSTSCYLLYNAIILKLKKTGNYLGISIQVYLFKNY